MDIALGLALAFDLAPFEPVTLILRVIQVDLFLLDDSLGPCCRSCIIALEYVRCVRGAAAHLPAAEDHYGREDCPRLAGAS